MTKEDREAELKSVKHFLLKFFLIVVCLLTNFATLFPQEIRVEDLKFKGNKAVSSGKLKKAIITQANPWTRFFLFWKKSKIFDEEIFLNDLLRIERYYHQEGYLEARVTDYELNFNQKRDEVNIVIYIEEGQPTKVAEVEIVPADHADLPLLPAKLKKMMSLKKGKRYREENLKLDYNKIIEKFSNLGYPYIQARVKPHINRQNHTVMLEWFLDPGPWSVFGEIDITGNKSISERVIRRGLGFKAGERFEQKKLVSAQTQIFRLELFQFVSLRATNLQQQPNQIPIEVRVKESKLRTLKFGVGYGSEESFRATATWRHRNFLGGARILRAEAKHSTNLLPLSLQLELSQPYFFGNKNDLIAKPFFIWQDEKSFEVRRIGLETTINRQLTKRTNLFITSRIERDTVSVKGELMSEQTERLEDLYNKSVLQVGVRRNSTDQLFSPTRGSISSIVVEEAGRFLQSRFKYLKLYGEYRKYRKIKPGYVFALRIFMGTMTPIRGSQVTPVEERFFSGGSYSVRGWGRQLLGPRNEENTPLGGNSNLEGSFELRTPIYKKFRSAIFLDYGNVWENWDGFDLLDLRYAIGAGIRYNTFIGPFRIDFAWKINKQPQEDKNYEIHISIGQAF
ncbi:MAG: outer membrane protein assembly factor BamA [bacterium]